MFLYSSVTTAAFELGHFQRDRNFEEDTLQLEDHKSIQRFQMERNREVIGTLRKNSVKLALPYTAAVPYQQLFSLPPGYSSGRVNLALHVYLGLLLPCEDCTRLSPHSSHLHSTIVAMDRYGPISCSSRFWCFSECTGYWCFPKQDFDLFESFPFRFGDEN